MSIRLSDEPLRRALERRSRERGRGAGRPAKAGKAFGFLSAKGGCGATTLACHVAAELGYAHQKVLLADLDLDAGMVAFITKTKSVYSILDAVNNLHRLDISYWKALVSNGIPGVEIVSSPLALACKQQPKDEQIRPGAGVRRAQLRLDHGGFGAQPEPHGHGGAGGNRRGLPGDHAGSAGAAPGQTDRADAARRRLRQEPLSSGSEPHAEAPGHHFRGSWRGCSGSPIFSMIPNDYPELYETYSKGRMLNRNSNWAGRSRAWRASNWRSCEEEQAARSFGLFGYGRLLMAKREHTTALQLHSVQAGEAGNGLG